MTALDLTTLNSIASISFDDFKTNYDTHIGNSVASYYDALNGAATTAGLTSTANSATRAMDTANDYGVSGAFENEYAKEVAAGVSVDLSVGSDAWLRVQYDQMQADLSARTAAIGTGGTGELDPNTALTVISDSFVNVPGLTASASPLYVPLQQLSVTDPAAAQALLNNYYAPDSGSVTGGIAHALVSSVELGFGAVVRGDDGLSGVLGGWSNQADWVGTMLTTASNLITGGGITLPDDMAATLGNLAGIFSLAGGELGTLAKWTDGFLTTAPTDPAHETSAPFNGCLAPWADAPTQTSPLVIDLSSGHTGITLTTFNALTTSTFFDLDSTGFAEQTAWVSGTTGLLVQDINSNGVIDNGNELFGSSTVDGFAKLAQLDSNHDLKIDSNDSAWSSLQVWVDSNGDGITQSGELHSLSSLGITSIDLAGVTSSTSTIDGNPISHTSGVTFSDGSTATIADAWFTHSTVNTLYNGDYTLDDATLFLPDLRGYGTLPQLAVAMSQDSTLEGLVKDYVSNFTTSGFSSSTLDSDAANIFYEWAGVASVDPSSRGPNVDAQHLDFLEHMFGQNYFSAISGSANPFQFAGADIELSWDMASKLFEGQLLLQAGASNLFANPVTYDAWTGTVDGDLGLSQTGVSALDDNAPAPGSSNLAYWENVAHFIDSIKGLDNLTTDESSWLNSAVNTSDSSLTWTDVLNAISTAGTPGGTIEGTSGNDTLTGTAGDDTILGFGGNDNITAGDGNDTVTLGSSGASTIHGGFGNDTITASVGTNSLYGDAGNDTIYGGSGNDTIYGGTGGNIIHGGTGTNTYVFGGGDDVISSGGSADQILLPSGIVLADLTFTRVSSDSTTQFNDLLITVADGGGSMQIIDHFVGSAYEVGTLVFSDSSTLDLTAISGYETVLTPGDDTYSPSLNSNQIIHGMDGNDDIVTGSGNDTLDGGNGNDILQSGGGTDTYIASPGFDTIVENGAGGTDTIVVPTGYSLGDVTFSRHIGTSGPDNDLIIDIRGLGEIRVENQFYMSSYAVENLYFTDGGTTVSLAGQTIQTIGSSGNDTLTGITSGVAGNWFDGRGGNDTINNGIGNNTYLFAAGFGTNTIGSVYHSGTNILAFTGIDPSHIRMWTTSNGSLHLQDTTDTSHSITVSAAVTGSGTSESAIGTYLEQISFDDSGNTTWDLTGGLLLANTSSGGSLYGTAYNDTLTGGTGNDTLYGNGGNDILVSRGGSDTLSGGTGNDTYVFGTGFGNTTVSESLSSGTDTIHFSGIDPSHIRMYTDSFGALYLQDTTNPSTTISISAGLTGSGFHESAIDQYVEQVTFEDDNNTVWNLTAGIALTDTSSGGTLYGTANNDILTGSTGVDTLYGNGGNDTLVSGGGADSLQGGLGNDTYVFASSFGSTTVAENLSQGTDTVNFTGIDPAHILMYTDTSGNLHFEDSTNASYNITVNGALTGSNFHESNIGSYVESVTFDASYGITWDLTGGLNLTNVTSGGSLYGTAYNDTLNGGSFADTLYGNGGNDTLVSNGGADSLQGGVGDDTYVFASGFGSSTVAENLSQGTDTIKFTGIDPAHIRMYTDSVGALHFVDSTNSSFNITVNGGLTGSGFHESAIGSYVESVTFDPSYATTWDLTGGLTLTGTTSAESLYGTANGDTISGMGGADSLYGNGGNDLISGGSGNDAMDGGTGTDTVTYAAATAGVTVSLATATAQNTVGAGTDTITNFENLTGSAFADTLTGDGNNNVIQGLAGNDILNGGAGTDTVTYADATAGITISLAITTGQVTGGAGTDTISLFENLTGSAFSDTLTGDLNANTIDGGAGNDLIQGGAGNDVLTGGAGTDTVTYAAATAAVTVNLATLTAQNTVGAGTDTISGFENLTGSAFNDTLTGDGNDNVIQGLAGNDVMVGGAGTDTLTYVAATAGVTVNLATATAQNTVGAGTDTISGFENLTGSAFADTLTGDGNNNLIDGGAGTAINDVMNGAGGTDTVTYISATAGVTVSLATTTGQVTGGAGTDTITNFENLTGSAFNDTLTGDANANTIDGGAGNDIIQGGAGNDVLVGGAGTDTATYAAAASAVTVSLAITTAQNTGGAGTDTISGFENLTGSGFNDTLTGDANANTISGGAGNDIIAGRGGADVLDGGAGTDTVDYSAAAGGTVVNLGTGTASNDGDGSSDTLTTFENITGSAFDDNLTGDANANVIDGGAGNDTIQGGAGNDTLIGGAGTDTVTYAAATAAVTVNLATLTAQNTVGAGTDTISGFENLTGSAFADTLTGDSNNNVIEGLAGNDVLNGGAGTDTVTYVDSTAAVTVNLATLTAQNTVGAGTDTISNFENLTGSAFNDTLTGDANNNVIQGLAGNDSMVGAAGTDTVTYVDATAGVTVSLAITTGQNTIGAGTDTISGFENLTGSAFNDILTGDANANVLQGLAGNDTLMGGAGSDTLDGGTGTDTASYAAASSGVTVDLSAGTATGDGSDTLISIENVIGSAYNDTFITTTGIHGFDGGAGTDTLSYAPSSVGVTVNLGTGAGTGDGSDTFTNIENIIGSAHNDLIITGAGTHVLDGGAGTDTVSYASASVGVTVDLSAGTGVGDGSDTLVNIENVTGSSHNDIFVSSSGNNAFDGGLGTDTVSYSAATGPVTVNLSTGTATGDGTDTLTNIENVTGSSYADTITGSSGANVLYGGGGADLLSGGSGADTFMFKALTALAAPVTIADFATLQGDKIDITDVLTGHYDPLTNAIADFVSLTASGSNTLLKIDLDGTGTTYTPTTIATISGVTGLDVATLITDHHLIVPT
jgi:Ca2+-binding RTX toxin-like protein